MLRSSASLTLRESSISVTRSHQWTNSSALLLAQGRDPVEAVREKARHITLRALDTGMQPPVDPFKLAELLGIPVVASPDIRDARTVVAETGQLTIEFNPDRPRTRVRYSIAHELAHTLFPDCSEHVRHRAAYHELTGDDYQLEALCNIAASEFLMPIGSLPRTHPATLAIEDVLALRKQYEVSTEAILIRLAQVLDGSYAMFSAAPIEDGEHRRYRYDYVVPGREWQFGKPVIGSLAPLDTVLRECSAIGYTRTAHEIWWAPDTPFAVGAVGVPPYPGSVFPRVVGFVTTPDAPDPRDITYEHRDAADPPWNAGRPLIAHIVNDRTPRWGGGFARNLGRRYPQVQEEFISWTRASPSNLQLGEMHVTDLPDTPLVAHMVAQQGYATARPGIRYEALERCLDSLALAAKRIGAAIFMPRIGTGEAGGDWRIIEPLLREHLLSDDIRVTVYDPPGSARVEIPRHTASQTTRTRVARIDVEELPLDI